MAKSPGQYIREELSQRCWTQVEFAQIIDRPIQVVNEIIKGKRAVTFDTAAALGAALGPDAATWIKREAEYRLSQTEVDTSAVARRVRLYDLAPVRDMEKRGWIKPTKTAAALETELLRFFGTRSLEEIPSIAGATRRSGDQENLSASQRAWCCQIRRIAASKLAAQFNPSRVDACMAALRKIAAYPQEIHKVPATLAEFGIRFVIVEPLPGCKVDGFATWLSDEEPVIGLSLRYNRIDGFWFTLCHELSHIRHHDDAGVDVNLPEGVTMPTEVRSNMELRADKEAAAMLVPPEQLNSFILRVGPLYSKDRIVQFAHKVKIHPGIIVGQLQHRGEVGYHAHRGFFSKVRHILVPAAVTDGWGHCVELGDS